MTVLASFLIGWFGMLGLGVGVGLYLKRCDREDEERAASERAALRAATPRNPLDVSL